jgi:hypothetical protein
MSEAWRSQHPTIGMSTARPGQPRAGVFVRRSASTSAATSWRSLPGRTCRRSNGSRLSPAPRAGIPVGRGDLLRRPVEDPRGVTPLLPDRDHPALGIRHLLGGPAQELPPVRRRVLLRVLVVAARLAAVVVPRIPPVAAPGTGFRVERLLQLLAGIVRRPRAGSAGRRALQPRERGQDLPEVLGPARAMPQSPRRWSG